MIRTAEVDALINEHGGERGIWGQHPMFDPKDWRQEVEDDDTRLGYWEWCLTRQADFDRDLQELLETAREALASGEMAKYDALYSWVEDNFGLGGTAAYEAATRYLSEQGIDVPQRT